MEQVSLNLCQVAWRFAAQKHQGQLYPGTDLPYLVHIGSVLLELGPALAENPALNGGLAVCCAILHDTLEDTETSAPELLNLFGPAVAVGVRALTKNKALSKHGAMRDSLERIKEEPHEIWLVKLADRAANLGLPPAHWSREKCLAYAEEAEMILEDLGEASAALSQRLAARIAAWRAG